MWENDVIIRKAFSDSELSRGVFSNWDGIGTRILTKPLIEKIKDRIDFRDVKVILDIGSRDGCQSLEFNRWFPEAKIYAFEPIPSSYEYTKNNVKDISNIEVFDYACSDKKGEITFYEVYNGNVGASSLLKTSNHNRARQWLQRETIVKSVILEDWLKEKGIDKIDIAWVDVQGAEEVLFKSFGSFLEKISAIATEVGVVPLYEGAITKEGLDNILTGFDCVEAEIERSGTEMDTIYINKNLK